MRPIRVLVAGGGVAGLETVLALRALAAERLSIELLAPGVDYVARQLTVRTPFAAPAAPRLPVERVGVPVRRAALARVDAAAHVVHATDGVALDYDRLVVAIGARPDQSLPGALHFHGPRGVALLETVLRDARPSPGRPVAFVVAPGLSWPLPVYELALAARRAGLSDVCLVTPERRPLELFGPAVSEAVGRLLDRADIELRADTRASAVFDGALAVEPGGLLAVAAAVTLPRLDGPAISGLPHDPDGFLPVDPRGRVAGVTDIFAAGDVTDEPVKQGGLAAEQGDVVAATIAAEAGLTDTTAVRRRVLRATLLAGEDTLYLRRELDRPDDGTASTRPLWQPTGKVAAAHLTGFLAGTPDALLADVSPTAPGRAPTAA